MAKKKNLEDFSTIIDLNIEKVLSEGFARYSKYIIQERALPDVRDGLKPVQRRILYSMFKEKNTSDKGYRKSAKTVGNVIGNYHPHGDTSVYDAMVRLSQAWKIREPLVDMHGNNGSIDNDPPAAMRYTEARLSKIAEEMLRDIDQYTVDFAPNFDDTEFEPIVLPARFPNLLVNGSQGISAGYATEIPPHNLEEVIQAVIYRMKHPFCTLDKIMNIVKGPDFPTGGVVQGIDGIRKAYETGKGKIVVRARYEIDKEKSQIIVHDIPYEVNKATLMKKLEDIRIDKVLDGFLEARDESDKDGLRIVIECEKDANFDLIINYLLKNSDLMVNYNFNMVVIHNKHPRQMGILDILDAYIEHQKDIVINRSNYQLAKFKKRLHILDGLIRMVSILDEVIKIIRHSENKAHAKENLIEAFDFTEEQAEAIVTLQLYRLTTTDVTVLQNETDDLTKKVKELQAILNNEQTLIGIIIKELEQINKQYKSPRLTTVEEEIEEIEIDETDMIKEEDVELCVTKEGYLSLARQSHGDVIESKDLSPKDYPVAQLKLSTLDDVLLFTNKGNYVLLHVHQIEITKPNEFHHLNDLVKIEPDEFILNVVPVHEYNDHYSVILATKYGYIKRILLSDFNVIRNYKTYSAITFKENQDEVVGVALSDNKNRDLCIITKNGYINKYDENQISFVKLKAAGVKSINLKDDDAVVSLVYLSSEAERLILVTQRGNLKTIVPEDIPLGNRTNRGTMTLKTLKRNNHAYIGGVLVRQNDMVFVETSESYVPIEANTDNVGEVISNGKSQAELDESLDLQRLSTIITNETLTYSERVADTSEALTDEVKEKAKKEITEEAKEAVIEEQPTKKGKKQTKTKKQEKESDPFEQLELFSMENLKE